MSTRLKLMLPIETRDGHDFWLRIEGDSGGMALVDGADVKMPWLRAQCSCGWSSAQHYTIEDNAWMTWVIHTDEVKEP